MEWQVYSCWQSDLVLWLRHVARAVENFPHLPRQAVRLVDAANLRVAITRAQQLRELSVAVKALVVQFHDEDVMEALEDFLESVGQWIDGLDVQRGNRIA